MSDPTNNNLPLALLDQYVAGHWRGVKIAYTAVFLDGTVYGLGVAVENKPGYWPVPRFVFRASSFEGAFDVAEDMNRHIGLSDDEATRIIVSSMSKPKPEPEFVSKAGERRYRKAVERFSRLDPRKKGNG